MEHICQVLLELALVHGCVCAWGEGEEYMWWEPIVAEEQLGCHLQSCSHTVELLCVYHRVV